jgi:[ribosomal protein S5]-alanine N-acetyltransferase
LELEILGTDTRGRRGNRAEPVTGANVEARSPYTVHKVDDASGRRPIRSSRLELVLMAPTFIEALLEGRRGDAARIIGADVPRAWPGPHDARFLRLRLEQVEREPDVQDWLVRAVVLREPERVMVGHAGFHGAPGVNGLGRVGALELGYTIFSSFRGRGYATEVAAALVAWARAERGVRDFIASVGPDNAPSLAVVTKLGFRQTGEQWDEEDGRELVFERTFDV